MHTKRHNHHHRRGHPFRPPVHGEASVPEYYKPLELFPADMPTAVIEKRASPSSTCTPDNTSPQCELPAAGRSKLPIILGAAIPVIGAIIILVFLHRRNMRRLRQEELNDKTKSMDFGMGVSPTAKRNNAEKVGKTRQLSMDLDLNNPYILPGARNSRESLSTLAAGLEPNDPRYALRPGTSHSRPGTSHSQNPQGSFGLNAGNNQRNYAPSTHSNLAHSRTRESSIYTASIRGGDDSPNGSTTSMSAELLGSAQQMAMSSPPPPRSASLARGANSPPQIKMPIPHTQALAKDSSPTLRVGNGLPSALQVGSPNQETRDSYIDNDGGDLRRSHQHLASHILFDEAAPGATPPQGPNITVSEHNNDNKPNVSASQPAANRQSEVSNYEDNSNIQFRFSVASAASNDDNGRVAQPVQPAPRNTSRDTLAPGMHNNRRLSMGFRPLPPDGSPDENPEERAMRIRSFYKEYFDESAAGDRVSHVLEPQNGLYEDDAPYMQQPPHMMSHQDDSAPVFDPHTNQYVIPGARPFAEPPMRRAMTPPPRMPQGHGGRPRAPSGGSARFMPPGPRSYSSQSGRYGPPMRGPPKRPMPPPMPLNTLPTPSQLTEDAFAMPIMFAPPPTLRDHVSGRDSPAFKSSPRPYSPAVSPHIPLVSAFDELPVLPSPHTLRKSGTYTALDFAPPRKFKNDDGFSDAGSIRSNGSGLNPAALHSIRAGAYRVSRIPQEVVPLRDDMAAQLKPTMDLSRRE